MQPEAIRQGLLLTGFGLATAFVVLGMLYIMLKGLAWVDTLKRGEQPQPELAPAQAPSADSTEARSIAAAIGVALAMEQAEKPSPDTQTQEHRWRDAGHQDMSPPLERRRGWRGRRQ